jgi:hypothetical protein
MGLQPRYGDQAVAGNVADKVELEIVFSDFISSA